MKTVPLLLLLSRTADGFGLTSTRFARASSVCRAVVTPVPASERLAASGRGIVGITLSPEVSSRGRPQSAVSPRELGDASEFMRLHAKAAWVVVGEAPLLAPIVEEQRLAAGLFPGPCPVVYRDSAWMQVATAQGYVWDAAAAATALQTAVLHGADAIVVPTPWRGQPAKDENDGAPSPELEASALEGLAAIAASAEPLGVAILPELLTFQSTDDSTADAPSPTGTVPSLNEAHSSSLISSLAQAATGNSGSSSSGGSCSSGGIVLVSSGAAIQLAGGAEATTAEVKRRATVVQAAADAAAGVVSSSSSQEGGEEKGEGSEGASGGFLKRGFSAAAATKKTSSTSSSIPKVASGPVRKAVTVVGVVSVPPGQDMLKAAVKSLESRGYAGALLSAEVVPPGLPMSSLGRYWAAATNDIRSKASATFQVRLKSFAEGGNSKPDAWQEYMKMTQETGLNAASDAREADAANAAAAGGGGGEDNGDWQGF